MKGKWHKEMFTEHFFSLFLWLCHLVEYAGKKSGIKTAARVANLINVDSDSLRLEFRFNCLAFALDFAIYLSIAAGNHRFSLRRNVFGSGVFHAIEWIRK